MKDNFKDQQASMYRWANKRSAVLIEFREGDLILLNGDNSGIVADIESVEAVCADCGQKTGSYVEVEGHNYCMDVNMCILHNCSGPGVVNYARPCPDYRLDHDFGGLQ